MDLTKIWRHSASLKCAVASEPPFTILRRTTDSVNRQQHQRDVRDDLARLRRLLRRALVNSGVSASREDELRILNLACGRCDEAELLVEMLPEVLTRPPSPSSRPAQTTLIGVDIREREIADAAERCRIWLREKRALEGSNAAAPLKFEFLAQDATAVDVHREIGDDFDVVFLRHQNLWDGGATWREIFAQGLEKLSAGGVMIWTSYFDREHALALEAIREVGGEIIVSEENPEGRRLPTPGKVVDKHVAVVRKRTNSPS